MLRKFFQLLSTKIIGLASSFIVGLAIARLLGAEARGEYITLLIFPQILLSFLELGVRQASIFMIGKKIYPIDKIVKNIYSIALFSSMILFVFALGYIFFSEFKIITFGKWAVLLLAPALIYLSYSKGILLGFEGVHDYAKLELFQPLFFMIGTLILYILSSFSLDNVMVMYSLSFVLCAIFSILSVKRKGAIKLDFFSLELSLSKDILKVGIVFSVCLFLINLSYKVDIFIIKWFLGFEAVGVYSVTTQFIELIWQFPNVAVILLMSLSANNSKYKKSEFDRRFSVVSRFSMLLVILCCIVFSIIGKYIIVYLYGDKFVSAYYAFLYAIPGIIAMTSFKSFNSFLAGNNIVTPVIKVMIVSVVINIVSNLTLIPMMGIDGAAIASSISYSLSTVMIFKIYNRNITLLSVNGHKNEPA